MALGEIETLDRGDGLKLAYARQPGKGPAIVFLSGFHSEMAGTKASYLADWAARTGRAFLRFDYSGHGRSEGAFEDGTIGRWRADTLTVLDRATVGPLVLVGSSMGGWMALLAALARPERIKALVLIAPAADFSVRLEASLPPQARQALAETGTWLRPSAYDEAPYPITRALIEEARAHLLPAAIPFARPVRILQGMDDPDVPWREALALSDRLAARDLVVNLIKDGDHRLSRPEDLTRLTAAIEEVCARL